MSASSSSSAKLNAPPTKLILNQSTSISLNDRFSQLAKTRRKPAPTQATIKMQPTGKIFNKNNTNNNRNGNLFQKRASARNRRLALQMANRPSVQAALKLKKKSIKQRLGGNAAGGIGGGAAAKINNRLDSGKGFLRQRIGNGGGIRRRTNIYSRLSGLRRGRGNNRRGGNNALNRRNLKARLGNIVNNGANNSTASNQQSGGLNTSLTKRRNAITNAGGVSGNTRMYNRGGNRRPMRGNNNRRGNNNGRGRGGNRRGNNRRNNPQQQQQQQAPKTRETLDNDLDQYMAKSKTSLNAELDQYMAQSH